MSRLLASATTARMIAIASRTPLAAAVTKLRSILIDEKRVRLR